MTVIEHENGIRRTSVTLDIEFSSWAMQGTRRRGVSNESSECMKYRPGGKNPKYGLGKNLRSY
jgi:hypothetical protein